MLKNPNRENIGKSVTVADNIRMTMTTLMKNRINPLYIDPETAVHTIEASKIERNFFIWKGFGNASSRSETQKEQIKAIVQNFQKTIQETDITCYTVGSAINSDKHGPQKCGSGVVIYSPTLDNQPKILSKLVSNYSSPYHGKITAINIALQECSKIDIRNVKIIHILSDCQSAILSSSKTKITYCY